MRWDKNRRSRRAVMRAAVLRFSVIGVTPASAKLHDVKKANLSRAQRKWFWKKYGFDCSLRSHYEGLADRVFKSRTPILDKLFSRRRG